MEPRTRLDFFLGLGCGKSAGAPGAGFAPGAFDFSSIISLFGGRHRLNEWEGFGWPGAASPVISKRAGFDFPAG